MIVTIDNPTGSGPDTFPAGRVCSTCSTQLSIYNRSTRCAVCNPPRQRLNRYQHERAMADLIELMEQP